MPMSKTVDGYATYRSQLLLPNIQEWQPSQLKRDLPYRQVRSTGELAVGQDVSLLNYHEQMSSAGKFLLSLSGLLVARLRVTSKIDGGQRIAVMAGAVQGVLRSDEARPSVSTLWRGEVIELGEERAIVTLTHGYVTDFGSNANPAELERLENPYMTISQTYQEMGLRPIPEGSPGTGRWMPNITVALTES